MNALRAAIQLPQVRPDVWLLSTLVIIACLGLVMVGSSSVAVADRLAGEPMYFFYRQGIYALIGLMFGYAVLHVPIQFWARHSFVLLAVGLALLVLVLVPGIGHAVNGSRRWLHLGLFDLQASEPARLFLVLYVAGYAARRQVELVTTWTGLFRPMVFILIASLLMLLEPDFGSGAMLMMVTGIILFVAGARLFNVAVLAVLGAGGLVAMVLVSPYRMERLTSFSDPWAHPYTSGFQLTQSLIAIGRGHVFGVGLGNSVQKLSYLPETHTDFLFAIYAEEFGLVGSLVLIALFSIVVWRGFVIARRALEAGQLFGGFLAYGLSAWLVLQAFVNMAVNMGLLPTKGLTLPLMSYGGSSLVMMCVLCALLLRVDLESNQAVREEQS